MKKCLLTVLVLSLCSILYAQDLIVPKQGNPITAYEVELSEAYVFYKVSADAAAQITRMPKDSVLLIRKADGSVVNLAETKTETQEATNDAVEHHPNIAIEDIHGYVLQKGNCVYVPINGVYDFERAGQLKLKELLKEWGYWTVVDDVKQAHFVIQMVACIKCTPDEYYAFMRHRELFSEAEYVDPYTGAGWKYCGCHLGATRFGDSESDALAAANVYFRRIKTVMTDSETDAYKAFHKYSDDGFNADSDSKTKRNHYVFMNWERQGL